MPHRNLILTIALQLQVFTDKDMGEILLAMGIYSNLTSARNNARKFLKYIVAAGRIEECNGYFRIIGSKSLHKEHSQLLTRSLVQIFKSPYKVTVKREYTFPCQLRADAVVLLEREDGKLKACILEVCHTETDGYLRNKHDEHLRQGVSKSLSEVFGRKIDHAAFCVVGKETSWATPLSEVLK